jgi:uncharacterized protein
VLGQFTKTVGTISRLAWGLGVLSALALPAAAGEVRDDARLFSDDARRQAEAVLDRLERETGTPVLIQTVESLDGASMDRALEKAATRWGKRGVFVLIARKESKIEVNSFREYLGRDRERRIYEALVAAFRAGDFDQGLERAVARIDEAAREVPPPSPRATARRGAPAPPAPRQGEGGSSGMPILMILGLVLLGVFVLGRLFNRRPAYGPGPGPFGAPGMGGPGYGGGGGFFSGILGGLGGALAGNWIYDQMTGRHHHGGEAGPIIDPTLGESAPTEADWGGGVGGDWGGGDTGGDWGGGVGGDWGGGDTGGGDWS